MILLLLLEYILILIKMQNNYFLLQPKNKRNIKE